MRCGKEHTRKGDFQGMRFLRGDHDLILQSFAIGSGQEVDDS